MIEQGNLQMSVLPQMLKPIRAVPPADIDGNEL